MNRWKSPRLRQDMIAAYILVLPMVLFILVFTIGPVIYAFLLSFQNFNMLAPQRSTFIGLKNYTDLFKDPVFKKALMNTFTYAGIVVPVQTCIALVLAVVANQNIRGKTFYRVAYYLPAVTSAVAVAAMFMFLFNTRGLVNRFFSIFGFQSVSWFANPKYALPLAMIMAIWSTVGTLMLIFLAGMQDIPESVYEAADVDGANKIVQFFSITVPLLREKTMFVVLIGFIGTLQMFDQAYVISQGTGGPINATMTVVLFLYLKAFGENRMGYGSAAAFVLFIIIFALTVVQKLVFERKAES